MRISKELIEKYHRGTCTPDQEKLIEEWLLSDDFDENTFPVHVDKPRIQTEMWDEISAILPSKEKQKKEFDLKTYFKPVWWQVAAAVILIGMIGSVLFYQKYPSENQEIVVMNNTSETLNKNLRSGNYTISVGPRSNVEINNQTGMIDFCGAMMINVKQDVEFTIQGTCAHPSDNSEKITLKKGLNYIALNYRSTPDANEVIIVEEGSMMGLPPLVMKQLMHQFKI